MDLVFAGLIFVLFDIDVAFGDSVFSFIPDAIGYVLIFIGLAKLIKRSERFGKVRAVPIIGAMLSVIIWIMDAMGISSFFGIFTLPVKILLCAASLVTVYQIMEGINDVEIENSTALYTTPLYRSFLPLAVTQALSLLTAILKMAVISSIALAVADACAVIFIVFFSKTRKAFGELPKAAEYKPNDDE